MVHEPALLLVAATERELCELDGVRPLCCGIGPVEAGLATARALASGDVRAVLHVGIAGAVGLEPGSVVIGSASEYCDVIAAGTTLPRISHVKPDRALRDAAVELLPNALLMPIGTTARVGGGLGHQVEAMEGFGVLRAAQLAGVPALEVRVISNDPAETDRSVWRIDAALTALHDAINVLAPVLASLRPD